MKIVKLFTFLLFLLTAISKRNYPFTNNVIRHGELKILVMELQLFVNKAV